MGKGNTQKLPNWLSELTVSPGLRLGLLFQTAVPQPPLKQQRQPCHSGGALLAPIMDLEKIEANLPALDGRNKGLGSIQPLSQFHLAQICPFTDFAQDEAEDIVFRAVDRLGHGPQRSSRRPRNLYLKFV